MLPSASYEINVRSAAFFIARRSAVCWRCRKSTSSIAVALPPGHQTLEADEAAEGESDLAVADVWQVATLNAFVFYVEYLPDIVRRQMQRLSSFYRLAHSQSTISTSWSNRCEHCESLQDDHELFCEPGGVFTPTSETEAAAIELTRIEVPFEASAAGYAYQPEFFRFMRRS